MSRAKQRDPFKEAVVGCLGFISLMLIITTISTWASQQ